MPDWVKRPYVPAEDEDGLVYMWLKQYAHSRYGLARGANRVHSPNEMAYWEDERPVVMALLQAADVEVVCDPDRPRAVDGKPAVIWGFVVTDGDVVHWVAVKHDAVKLGFGPDIVRDLLGGRLHRPCGYARELVGMHRSKYVHRVSPKGEEYSIPWEWYPDPDATARLLIRRRAA